MSDGPQFEPPPVTDADIRWASNLLGLGENGFHGEDGDDARQAVLKTNDPLDVAACPGSGKTTLLVAKLAILAQKWPHRTRGICVLSHTNAARHEIETRLGNTSVGRGLLSYPHFVGTIHGFVNDFLAVPWLRSKGFSIKMIDTHISTHRRWNALTYGTRQGIERNHEGPSLLQVKSPDFSVRQMQWGGHPLGLNSPTYVKIREICKRSICEGYFCYDEMFVWADELMQKCPGVVPVIRNRFPMLFIDEAQDNREEQSKLLHCVFIDGDRSVLRQRFGDANQAIFDEDAKEATTDIFPDEAIKKNLPNSHRFGQVIADFADPLALCPHGLKGQGPKQRHVASVQGCQHSVFLFDKDSAKRVLDAYGELLVSTFRDQHIFTAVGQVHRPPEEDTEDKFPRHIAHFWPDYNPELSRKDPKPSSFVGHVSVGQTKAAAAGEAFPAVDSIAEGVLRLAESLVDGCVDCNRRQRHRLVLELLDKTPDVQACYNAMVGRLGARRIELTKETWENRWCGIARRIGASISGVTSSNAKAEAFLAWQGEPGGDASGHSKRKSSENIYRFQKDGRTVAIQLGSIHSVKGQTHTATLVLETFWYKHNLESIRDWLCNGKCGGHGTGVQIKNRLKLHYVAMTRPTHLLCLAMKRSTFEKVNGELDQRLLKKLTDRGWVVKEL
jgi:DNA helicase-2/ATP-dependent DNA helicase PcrA